MDNNIRNIRQQEFAEQWLKSNRFSIMYLAPRFGKCRCTIRILQKEKYNKILIAFPDNKIKTSWKAEFEIMGYDDSNVTYTTHLSLKKYVDKVFDLIILDECHLISPAQIEICKKLFETNKVKLEVLCLTGTLSRETKNTLWNELKLPILATYSIEQAIEEGVIADYEISVIKVPLDNTLERISGKKSEKKMFDNLTWVIDKLEREEKSTFFLRLKRMRIIQNSLAKLNETKRLLWKYKDDRILIFCGITKIADSLGIPSYHSKSAEKKVFDDFASGKGKHLAVVRIGNTGVNYVPLNRVIINYFSSSGEDMVQKINRCMSFEYNNPEKKAYITIISSNESIELKWLTKAISMFDPKKIKYL